MSAGASRGVRVGETLGRLPERFPFLRPSLVGAVVALATIVPQVWLSAQHHDEDQYAWSAAYYGKKILHGDFGEKGTDIFRDPGWDPTSYWGRSMGTRGVLAIGLATPWARAPALPYSYREPALQGRAAQLDRSSLVALRLLASLCAVLGAVLIAWRLGWIGALAVLLLLALPHNAENFSRAWAEGPMLLAFGLVAAAYGTRVFPLVLGAVSTVKFTLVGLWPLLLLRAAHHWRSRLLALLVTAATWVVLTPPSWYRGGPLMLLSLGGTRVHEYRGGQAADGSVLFLPARYFWPFELGLALLAFAFLAGRWSVGGLVRARRGQPDHPFGRPSADASRVESTSG
jgi:hypothetical protein